MNLFGIGFVAVLVIITVGIIDSILKNKKIKNQELLPILEFLYKNPNEKSKHKDYFDKIKLIDQQVKKNSTPIYSPGEFVFNLLVQHSCKYPTDTFGYERFIKILDISTQISFPAFTYLIEQIVKLKNNHVLYEILFKSIVVSKFLPDFIFEILISYLEKNPTDPSAHSIFITGIDKILVPRNNIHQIAYNKTLEILEIHP
ncbi:hypothetical protein [Nostoc sp.]|uniref:hypothetical protein n=1 Tax=Nostoc sp. TaxID=1180 RepID=UPI002FF5BDFD